MIHVRDAARDGIEHLEGADKLSRSENLNFKAAVIAVIARPSLSALLPRPGRPFGQLVTILSSWAPCAMAGAGNVAAAPATAPARIKKLRRSMARFLRFFRVSGSQACERPGHRKFSQMRR